MSSRPTPFLSVYLNTEAGIDNAAHRSAQRWKALRQELQESDVPETLLDEIETLVADAHLSGDGLAVIGDANGIRHVEHGPSAPPRDVGRWAPLPHLVPLFAWRQAAPAYVVVTTDRRGADLFAFRYAAPDLHREAGGADDPITKVAVGGWSQRRYQERAENTWEHNADDVAKQLTRLVEEVDARIVLVAGDERAVQLLRSSLSADVDALVELISGGRGADGSDPTDNDEVRRLVQTAVARDSVAMIEKFKEELGQQDRAAAGVEPTMRALSMAQVEVLLVAEPSPENGEGSPTVWFGQDPSQLGDSATAVTDLGATTAQEGDLTDAFVRSALCTSAKVRVLPRAVLNEGVGAILRWSA